MQSFMNDLSCLPKFDIGRIQIPLEFLRSFPGKGKRGIEWFYCPLVIMCDCPVYPVRLEDDIILYYKIIQKKNLETLKTEYRTDLNHSPKICGTVSVPIQ